MTTDLYALLLRVQEYLKSFELHPFDDQYDPLLADVDLAIAELRSQLGPFAELRAELPQER